MTDWDLMKEYIQNAMQAVDQAHAASEKLRNHTTPEHFDEFKEQMETLCTHLRALKQALEYESAYSMDDLIDLLSEIFSGRPAAYRRTQRIGE